ncbi:MAG: hypothetical protein AVDCRST_MAG89-4026 [uncultured Gemmatimonadetes bacterium]|uniref:SCP domain-containing protein n=1 Tax=uncultured Gemmatimonadota bacterium TaxID=203437 RepID=A0A6J4MP37_9BACT|nr:MAG: hypothetical protein AVDCRST_MAG89-4026 [uncultured Gemmatimonadota bacterium]
MRRTAVAAPLLMAACMTIPIGAPPAGGGAGTTGTTSGAAAGGAAMSRSEVQQMEQLVNRHSTSVGCPPLAPLGGAARAAQLHSEDMARRGYFDHTSPDGQQPWDRVAAQGVRYRMVGENIAHTPGATAAETLRGWIASPGHRRNLENCGYTHHGVGLSNARWTHVFVTPP